MISNEIKQGNSLLVLPTMDADVFDSCVTDPPYELGFMGKSWDSTGIAYDVNLWRAVYRVLKPGAYLLAFGGTRTYHRMACAIEDAGFEIRDQIQWLYGSGFPKSLDVSKAIDKMRVEDVEPTRAICRSIRQAMDDSGLKSKDLVSYFDNCHPRLIDHWAARDTDSQPSLPTLKQWEILKTILPLGDELDTEVFRLNDRKGTHGDIWNNAEIVGEYDGVPGGLGGERFTVIDKNIRAATDAAKQWDGWGTALKPANEPICLARKPLEKGLTVAQNVLKWGTGAINIDGCRVEGIVPQTVQGKSDSKYGGGKGFAPDGYQLSNPSDLGRWPANIIHDGSDEVLAGFPETTTGDLNSAGGSAMFDGLNGRQNIDHSGSTGSAARFFYCAKASGADRNQGLNGFEAQFAPTMGDGIGGKEHNPETATKKQNHHPTVKPVDLMQYLCRLVTPPDGLILDPFLGSGSTMKAALIERFRCVGIEMNPEYAKIAQGRLNELQTKLF